MQIIKDSELRMVYNQQAWDMPSLRIILKTHYRQSSKYKSRQISKLKCFSSRLAVIFAQSTEVRCSVENEVVINNFIAN